MLDVLDRRRDVLPAVRRDHTEKAKRFIPDALILSRT
jgi:hypothetical protein